MALTIGSGKHKLYVHFLEDLMGRRGQSITLSISDIDKAQLEQLAQEQGMLWGDRPNISRLVEAIARRDLLIGRNNDWSNIRIQALQQVMRLLVDTGQIAEARLIAELLLERSELTVPLRRDIEQFLETPLIPWRQDINRYILQQQPFQLSYHDAADRPWIFTIRFAQVAFHERRQYLECWCDQTEGNQDISDLTHNWCLRLDRIPEAAILTIEGNWRTGLDHIDVEMHILRGLAFAYQAKTEDQINEWLPDKPQVRLVVRRVSNTFWFFREILPYAEDCVIVTPQIVRDRFKEKLRSLYAQYD